MRSFGLFFVIVATLGTSVFAQDAKTSSMQQHGERLASLRALVQQCEQDNKACVSANVGADERLKLANGVETRIDYAWLRKTIDEIPKLKPNERKAKAEAALKRLQGDAAPAATVSDAEARRTADAILKDVEFAASKPSWFEVQWDKLIRWLFRHTIMGEPDASTRTWMRFLMEILLFAIPLVLLCIWFVRQMREDRLVPHFAGGGGARGESGQVAWMQEAQAYAAQGMWREAVHAIYWHSITMFEERKVWSVSRTRTPREYLALLQPGSERRSLLREQTQMLESIWYGNREATARDYERATQLTEELARA